MSWFSKDTGGVAKDIGSGIAEAAGGLRNLITGDTPPAMVLAIETLEANLVQAKWESDSKTPWYQSSRSIVMLWLNFHSIVMVYIVLATDVTFNSPAVVAVLSLTAVVNTAFFGSKGIEYVKAGKAP